MHVPVPYSRPRHIAKQQTIIVLHTPNSRHSSNDLWAVWCHDALRCIQCQWARRIGPWWKRLPWLAARRTPFFGALVHVTCKMCLRANQLAPRWATPRGLQMSHFLNRQRSRKHQCAAADRAAALYLSARGIKTFAKLLEDFRAGKANGQNVQGIGCQAKVRKKKYCLAEAIRQEHGTAYPKRCP